MAIDSFINAASQGDVETIRALLEFGNIDLNEGDYDRRTALHLAAGEGRLTIVKLLCEAGANVNVEDRWGNRPLDDAESADKNSAAIVKILEQYGATTKSDAATTASSEQQAQGQVEDKGETSSGTVAYMAPELFVKGATPTPAADMWAAGVILYIILTGSHPFDKHANATDEEVAQNVIKVASSSKMKDGEEQLNLMDKLVFDERIEGLSESCIDLMRQLMHPDPEKRMTSDDFRRHAWVQGLTASWKTIAKGFEQLQAGLWQNRFRAEILKKFATSRGVGSNGETLSKHDLEAMFRALDLKKNGVLELEDIKAVFRDLNISDKNIHQIFAHADLDGTGVIRLDEFLALMGSKHTGGDEDDGAGDNGPGLQVRYLQNRFKNHILATSDKNTKLREIFNAIDLDGNGVLDPHEIRVVLRAAGEQEDVISRIVASLDANRDGGVDWTVFQDIMGRKDDDE